MTGAFGRRFRRIRYTDELTQSATLDDVVDTSRSPNNDVNAKLEPALVVPNVGAANEGLALSVHVVAQSYHDLLDLLSQLASRRQDQSLAFFQVRVDLLQDSDRERGRLPRTGLGLSDDVVALRARNDSALLDS